MKKLEKTADQNEIKEIWAELWSELYHQGNVGLASYLALPQMVRICKLKNIFDTNLLGLCAVIEQQRAQGTNPSLPVEFELYYKEGLDEFCQYIVANINRDLDRVTLTLAISALATCKGLTKLGEGIMEMEDPDILDEFLERF